MIVVFGSINIDLIFALPALPGPGQTLIAHAMRTEPGGKGANQALAAARDGADVVLAGAVGRDALADPALGLLRQSGVDLARVTRLDAPTGCAAICTDPQGRNQIVVNSGANALARADQVEDALLGPGTTLVLQRETDAGETEALVHRARRLGTRIVLNLAPALPLDPVALRALDWLVANEEEAAWLAARLGCAATADALATALGIGVVRTLGEAGAEAAHGMLRLHVPASRVTVRDTTAAGDCFTGVMAAGLDRGLAAPVALVRATAAAGLACTRPGSQGSLPHAAETDAALS